MTHWLTTLIQEMNKPIIIGKGNPKEVAEAISLINHGPPKQEIHFHIDKMLNIQKEDTKKLSKQKWEIIPENNRNI